MDTTITDFMCSWTGGQVSLFLSMNKNYSCYVTSPERHSLIDISQVLYVHVDLLFQGKL